MRRAPIRRPGAALVALSVASVLVLTGCATTTDSPYTRATRGIVAELSILDSGAREEAVMRVARQSESVMWEDSGLDDDLGGPASTARLLDDALQSTSLWVEGERRQPTELRLASYAAGGSAFGSAIGTGFVAIGALGNTAVSQTNNGTTGTETTGLPGGEAVVSVDAEGGVRVDMSISGSEGDLTVKITASADLDPCPDAEGRLELSTDVDVRVQGKAAGASIQLHVDATGLLDDDANLVGTNYTYRQQFAANENGKGQFLDHSANASGDVTLNRNSDAVTTEFVTAAAESAAALAYLVANDMQKTAEIGWSSGRCVDLTVTPSESASSLEPGARITIEAAPRGKHDGSPTGGSVVASYSGDGSLKPTGSKQAAPATFDYEAPSEKDKSGIAVFESRSKRGIGTASLTLTTGEDSYSASGGLVEYAGEGLICSLTAPFTIRGNTIDIAFAPSDRLGGSWRASGGLSDLTFTGDGTYTVVYAEDNVATALELSGTVATIAPDGQRFDGPGDLQFALSPVEGCD